MVQRKLPRKLGIQDDHVKSDRRVLNLKPSCSQHQDGRSRGTDMKKKMKKARSIKLSDIESLTSSPVRNEVPQPGEPPPIPRNTPVASAIHNKQPVNKTSNGSPNYMKPTTSSYARKEQTQVGSRNSQTISNAKSISRRSTNGSKQFVKQSAKGSSLKLVRTLTKAPNFKLARPSSKQCSKVVLCADMDVQRATCSSTMKDSKFPDFLELNPGGTEADGTSVLKVCPYTYCSLNGHHHPLLPPLKCFLAARRRLLKTRKSTSLECLSPEKVKPSEAKDNVNLVGVDEVQEEELHNTATPAVIKDETEAFFIEIYAREREETAEVKVSESSEDDTEAEADDEQVADSVSDEQLCSETDYEDDLDINLEEDLKDLTETEAASEKGVDVESLSSDQDKIASECLHDRGELDCKTGVQLDEFDFEACDMEWEQAPYSNSIIEIEAEIAAQIGNICDEAENMNFPKESILETDGVESNSSDENSADDLQQVPEEDASWVSYFSDINYEDYGQVQSDLDSNSQNQMPDSAHDEAEESMVKENQHCKTDNFSDCTAALASIEEPISVTIEDYFSELAHSTDAAYVTLIYQQEDAETEQVLQDIIIEKGVKEDKEVLKADEEEMCEELGKSLEMETIEDPKLETTADRQSQTVGETDENCYVGIAEQFNSMDDQTASMKFNKSSSWTRNNANQEDPTACSKLKLIIGSKRLLVDSDERRKFNPKGPNFLPVQPDPEAEKVDLKHRMMNDRKNAEEWMVDFALQRAVNKLATARKKKVALLVEAFETEETASVEQVTCCSAHLQKNQRKATDGITMPFTSFLHILLNNEVLSTYDETCDTKLYLNPSSEGKAEGGRNVSTDE
ncbi:Calmodulin-binding domain, plant [Dillenia turbinata]|uniref:Calmodulin-binding domain, plant n=1 Tax=Dillenia turbinata TaxID=194707 RepID=A0AAN8VGY0_9MAGN